MSGVIKELEIYRELIKENVTNMFPEESSEPYSGFLIEPIRYHMNNEKAKLVRPVLCIQTGNLLGVNFEKTIVFATACELVHNAFLILDDILDGDIYRRDEYSLWYKYGLENGINCGTYLINKAYECIITSNLENEIKYDLINTLNYVTSKTIEGQSMDNNSRGKNISMKSYLYMSKLKTGYLIALPIVGACIISGLYKNKISHIWDFCENIGVAYQIKDDIIDMTLGSGRKGNIGNDIKEGKPSILYVLSLEVCNDEEKEYVINIMNKNRDDVSDLDVIGVNRLYVKYGLYNKAQLIADQLKNESIKIIKKDFSQIELESIFNEMIDRAK